MRYALLIVLGGCNMLEPRTSDVTVDGAMPIDEAPDAPDSRLLPAGTPVPSIATNAELLSQIKVFDGLSDNALMTNNGVVLRSTGKANGATVYFWNFGSAPVSENFAVGSTLYILCDDDGAGTLTPRTDHPFLIDAIPGDVRYAAVRRLTYVPVTAAYDGELITSVDALNEALDRGLVGEPVLAGTWRNMPVVPPGTRLELGGAAEPMPALEVYGRGYVVELFPLGGTLGTQPLRNGQPPMGHELRLLSGVATGTPPAMPTSPDSQPVFQYGIPAAPPAMSFNYTPLVTAIDVRLASGKEPGPILSDATLFKRSASGSITGYYPTEVDSYVVTTTVSNKQIQFVEGQP